MSPQEKTAEQSAANRPRDLISRLYREIGISAVAAALEAGAAKPKKPAPARKDYPPFLRNDEAA